MAEKNQKHNFALYYELLTDSSPLKITDPDLVHRVTRVLRLGIGESFMLFNTSLHVDAVISVIDKKGVTVTVVKSTRNTFYKPEITFLLPLLKKDAFETAIYHLVSCGVTRIQPILCEQSHRGTITPSEWDRIQRIIIEAAQVSKNYVMSLCALPIALHDALKQNKGYGIFFDPEGAAIYPYVPSFEQRDAVTLLIGPEADFTVKEKKLIKEANFQFYRLTPTILKAEQAALLGAGLIRSLVKY